jgi:hypothetical protein
MCFGCPKQFIGPQKRVRVGMLTSLPTTIRMVCTHTILDEFHPFYSVELNLGLIVSWDWGEYLVVKWDWGLFICFHCEPSLVLGEMVQVGRSHNKGTRWVGFDLYMFSLRSSPPVLSTWPSKREFDEEKSKHFALLCQQNSFAPAFFSTGFFFWGKISPNFNLKIYIWFRPMQRIFHGNHGPNSPDFKKRKALNRQIFTDR